MDILLLIVVLVSCVIAMLAANTGIGRINENLETINPKTRKVKIPEKLKYYIPQYCRHSWETPPPRKSELYVLTVVLAVCNYIFHILCLTGAIIIYLLVPSGVGWIILPIGCFLAVFTIILFVTDFQREKIETKNPGRLDKDFTIDKKEDENDK